MSHEQYLGMSYEQASREGSRLISEAELCGSWFELPEKLMALRTVMRVKSPAHNWVPSALGHGNKMCTKCFITDLEAAALRKTGVCEG